MRRGPGRATIARVLALAALMCLVSGLVGAAAAQETDDIPRPEVFGGSASSLVASGQIDREALIPVPDLFKFIALDGEATYETANQQARASLIFPGNGMIQGPSLLCGTFGGQFPEQFKPLLDLCLQYSFPLSVFADSLDSESSSTGSSELGSPSDPISAANGRAKAVATLEETLTDATISNFQVAGIPPFGAIEPSLPVPGFPELDATIFRVDSARSETDQRILEDGTLRVHAVSTLNGVHLVGGLVQIDSIRSESLVTDDGRGGKTQLAELDVSGVTVGGLPARITEKGLVIDDSGSGPLDEQLANALNDLLGDFGVSMTTLDVDQGVDDRGIGSANVGGVFVEFAIPVDGLPVLPGPIGDIDPNGTYVGTLQLGVTGVTGIASVIETPEFVPEPFSPTGPSDVPSGSFTPAVDPPAPVDGVPEVAAPAQPASGAAPDVADGVGGASQRLVPIVDRLFSDRLGMVYLSFTLSFLAFCISPRFTLTARLPGGRG